MNRLLLLCLVALAGCATSRTFYPLAELQALDQPDDHAEVLANAMEVAPSQRGDTWRGVVERAAIAQLGFVKATDAESGERLLALTESQPARFPFLARSTAWLARRADVGVEALPLVASRGDRGAWPRRVLAFAQQDAVTPHLAQRLADDVLLKGLIPSTAYGLYSLALERDGEQVCSSPTLTKVVIALAEDSTAFEAAFKLCWKQLEAPMLQAAAKTEDYSDRLHLCTVLKTRVAPAQVPAECPKE